MVVAGEAHGAFFFCFAFRAGEKVFEGDAGKGEGVADACAHAATGAKLSVDVRRAVLEGKCASGAYRLASRAA